MNIVAKDKITEAFKDAFRVDPHLTLEQCIDRAIDLVVKATGQTPEVVRQVIEEGEWK